MEVKGQETNLGVGEVQKRERQREERGCVGGKSGSLTGRQADERDGASIYTCAVKAAHHRLPHQGVLYCFFLTTTPAHPLFSARFPEIPDAVDRVHIARPAR